MATHRQNMMILLEISYLTSAMQLETFGFISLPWCKQWEHFVSERQRDLPKCDCGWISFYISWRSRSHRHISVCLIALQLTPLGLFALDGVHCLHIKDVCVHSVFFYLSFSQISPDLKMCVFVGLISRIRDLAYVNVFHVYLSTCLQDRPVDFLCVIVCSFTFRGKHTEEGR